MYRKLGQCFLQKEHSIPYRMHRELDLYDHLKRAQRSTEILLKICIGRLWIQGFKIKFQNYWIHKILRQYFFTLDIF